MSFFDDPILSQLKEMKMFHGNNPFLGTMPGHVSYGLPYLPMFQPAFQASYAFTPANPTAVSHMNGHVMPMAMQMQMPMPLSHALLPTDQTQLQAKMDLLCQQMATLTEVVRSLSALISAQAHHLAYRGMVAPMMMASPMSNGLGFPTPLQGMPGHGTPGHGTPGHGSPGMMPGTLGFTGFSSSPVGVSYEHCPVQIRETESFICWQIPFANLNLGDIEVEVLGNRVICRTKAAIPANLRFWQWTILPQGVQFFELPDGRVECSCVIPVAFEAKEVEAVFRDGAISIYIPKSEAAQRQTVRIGKEAPQYVTAGSSSRKSAEMRT